MADKLIYSSQRTLYAPKPGFDSLLFKSIDVHPTGSLAQLATIPYVPTYTGNFCVPPNPVFKWMSLSAELNLFKIRNCMNIAGMKRDLEPYAAPTDTVTGLPSIGTGGNIVLPGIANIQPTEYRYEVLIERAKQLVSIAQQMESAFLAALEKRDAEFYNLLRAKQDLETSKSTVKLKQLEINASIDEVTLASMQKDRAELQVEGLEEMINAGLNEFEERMIGLYQQVATMNSIIAGMDFGVGVGSAAAQAVNSTTLWGGIANIAYAALYTALGAVKLGAQISMFQAESGININSLYASQARRAQEWNFQKTIAQQDVRIGSQQVKISQDRLAITNQEKVIAELQQEHAEVTVDFLGNKFTNYELYDWMSGVLERAYSYFLQISTATAKLALNQVAFERQTSPPPLIQNSYWESPSDNYAVSTTGSGTVDRRGLTGSSRLQQDIYQLDQYAIETDKRKLQISKTFSLAMCAPMEFQTFRETGTINFETLMNYFDRDFPGQYLRIIKKVRVTVIALVPATTGIRATLTSSGVSRVVIKGDTFQETTVRRSPEMVSFTGTRDATGLFDMQPENAKFLNPFEGSGVHMLWRFEMPKDSNYFDYSSIADVLFTIDYTALFDYTYQRQVKTNIGADIQSERAFSFRQEYADQFYELCHPDESDNPGIVSFDITKFMFPANMNALSIDDLKFYFVREVDEDINPQLPFEKELERIELNCSLVVNNTAIEGGGTINGKGILTTVGGSGGLGNLKGESPFGIWQIKIINDKAKLFKEGKILDVIMIISYTAELPGVLSL